MASKTTREKNHVIKTYLAAARALEHAARQFENAKPYGAHIVAMETSSDRMLAEASELLCHAKVVSASDKALAIAWDGELELEV